MRTIHRLGLVLLSLALACDSSGEKKRTSSRFPDEDPFARQIFGRVSRGADVVQDATVLLSPAQGYPTGEASLGDGNATLLANTDRNGLFRFVQAPSIYDLSVYKDREVVAFLGLLNRFLDLPISADGPVQGFTASVIATTDPPPAAGNAIAFFVTGSDARAISGDASPYVVTFRQFESRLTLIAVEYVRSEGLAAAVREGQVDIRATSGGRFAATVATTELRQETTNEVSFAVQAPDGFALQPFDVIMDFGVRTAALSLGRLPPQKALKLTPAQFPPARYIVRATATNGEAILSSAFLQFDPFATVPIPISLPTLAGETSFDGATFSASGTTGVVEHVLTPLSPNGLALRMITTNRMVSVPDVTRLGLPHPAGSYTWTVQHFPTLARTDFLANSDMRLFTPVATTAPRTIELR